MKIHIFHRALCAALLSAGTLFAQAPASIEGRAEPMMRGLSSLTAEERERLSSAHDKALQDPKIQAAQEKLRQSEREFRAMTKAAMIAADPTIEPLLNKLQEAREKSRERRGRKPAK